ncbi:MAG: DUF5916 domain-containing protein [Gemmatimonadales bacterium]|nr:DUF5916 domain-containing protein [Gemmatimonadales bacterium]
MFAVATLLTIAFAGDTVRAVPARSLPRLDGRLDDPAWAAATPVGGFVQRTPNWNQPGSERTEARVVYGADALYVGVQAWDREPEKILAPLARRDETITTDRIGVSIDSWHDRRTAFTFMVNPAGVKFDTYVYDDATLDFSWDATWDVAVLRDSTGWSAEFRIPFSQLRYGSTSEPRFGFNVLRTIARRNEVQQWHVAPQDLSQFVSQFGELTGLEGIAAPRRVEVVPYVLGRGTFDGSVRGNPIRSSRAGAGTAGADIRLGLGASMTLAAALNPDFGQIDGDPSEVNLAPTELFNAERRPFFSESSDALRVPLSLSASRGARGAESLLYSRRIGRAPQLSASSRGGWVDAPRETTILAAAKLVGKTASGWSIGALAAITEAERAIIAAPNGDRYSDVVEPRTLYSAGRLARDLRGGRTVLAAMSTLVHRSLDSSAARSLRRDAVTAGIDLAHRWGRGDGYQLRAGVTGSLVTGSEAAIGATQRSAVHYFQRPDNDAATLDSTRTSLSGANAVLALEKRTGDWRFAATSTYRTPGFEANDLGLHFTSGRSATDVSLLKRWTRSSFAQNAELRLNAFDLRTVDGDRINAGASLVGRAVLRNNWSVTGEYWRRLGGVDPLALRGGPALAYSGNGYVHGRVETDASRPLRVELNADWWRYREGNRHGHSLTPSATWRPSARTDIGVGLRMQSQVEDRQFVGSTDVAGARRYLVGEATQRTGGITLRSSLTFSPTLSLQLWAEPFTTSGEYRGLKMVTDSRASKEVDRFLAVDNQITRTEGRLRGDLDHDGINDLDIAAPDLTSTSLRSNLVLRWEFRPSSTLFLVWQQERSRQRGDGSFSARDALSDLGHAPARNLLAAKVSWWWTPR